MRKRNGDRSTVEIVPRAWYMVVAATCALSAMLTPARADDLEEICSGTHLPFESPAFERFDRNGDNRLTPDEAAECDPLEAVYGRLDLDADGALTRAEYGGFADVWRRRVQTFGEDAR